MKICIASKNRAESITTHMFFNSKDVFIFVEPQEYKKYKIFNKNFTIIDIKKNNQGISYVRNFILDYTQNEKIIMADDDITFFGERNEKYRYDELLNPKKILIEIENGLDIYSGYTLPRILFSFFTNKDTNNKRFFIN